MARVTSEPVTKTRAAASKRQQALLYSAIAAFAFFALYLLLTPLYRIGLWLEQPNEGWNAIHAVHAFSLNLYPRSGRFIINNYPPLWFYLTGALSKIYGDPIFPGRVIAFLAFIATGLGIYASLRALNVSRSAGCVAALSFITILAGLLSVYVGLSEPQMLAHALVTAGTALMLGSQSRRWLIASAFVVMTGLFVKHTVVALPLASAFWLFRFRRNLFWPWITSCAAIGIIATSLLLIVYGWSFLENIAFPRSLDLNALGTNAGLISKAAVPLVVYFVVVWRRRGIADEKIAFANAAIVAGVAALLIFGSARGVSINSVFDLVIASSIALGLAWGRLGLLESDTHANGWRIFIVTALALRIVAGSYKSETLFDAAERASLLEQSAVMQTLRDELKPIQGPVVCETLSVCIWAGHASDADLWKLRHEKTLGPFMDTNIFLKRISNGEFGAVVSFGTVASSADDKYLKGLSDALKAGYVAPVGFGRYASVYRPRERK